MNQRATAQRFATRGQLRSRGNDVNVSCVIDDLVFGDRWLILILVPKEAHALGNMKSIQHPADRTSAPILLPDPLAPSGLPDRIDKLSSVVAVHRDRNAPAG